MTESEKKPEIRFAGFNDAWEQRKLGDEVVFYSGLTYSPSDVIDSGGTLVLRSSNVKGGEIMDADNVYVSSEVVNSDNVQVGDVIVVVRNGSRSLIGKHAQIKKIMNNTVIGAFMTGVRYQQATFLNALLSTLQFDNEIGKNIGATINQITTGSFKEMQFYFPDTDEQKHIGDFFLHLDNLITLHQRKYDKLVIVKKSMLEKMFPKDGADVPEIRFAGFTDAWEQWKVGDVLTEKQRPIKMEDDEEYQLVTVKRRNEGIVSRGYFKGKDILVKNYFEIRSGDYLISKRQVIHGANGIVPENLDKSIVSNEYLVAVGNKNITTEYWTLISKMPNMYRQFFLSSYGVDIEKLVFDVEDWKKRTIILPSLPEQEKITLFFQRLDNLITLHQRQLEKLKNIKKSLLEKMFV